MGTINTLNELFHGQWVDYDDDTLDDWTSGSDTDFIANYDNDIGLMSNEEVEQFLKELQEQI